MKAPGLVTQRIFYFFNPLLQAHHHPRGINSGRGGVTAALGRQRAAGLRGLSPLSRSVVAPCPAQGPGEGTPAQPGPVPTAVPSQAGALERMRSIFGNCCETLHALIYPTGKPGREEESSKEPEPQDHMVVGFEGSVDSVQPTAFSKQV